MSTGNFTILYYNEFIRYFETVVMVWLSDFSKMVYKYNNEISNYGIELSKKLIYCYFNICKNIQKKDIFLYSIVSYIIALKYCEDEAETIPLIKLAYSYCLKKYDIELLKNIEIKILEIVEWKMPN